MSKKKATMNLATIHVACSRTPVWRKGVWAVHESVGKSTGWTITHIPTGRGAARFVNKPDAISCAEDMFKHAPRYGARAAFGSAFKGRGAVAIGAVVSAHYDGAP